MRTAVVLGAGGVLGVAYHAGVLAALQHDLGWDARDADVVVGTSAGSVVGSLLRRGAAPTDLAAVSVGAEALDTPAAIVEQFRRRGPSRPMILPAATSLEMQPPDPAIVMRWMISPWSFDPLDALVNMLPDGDIDLVGELERADGPLEAEWPDADLLVCAVRRRDCPRVVLDRQAGAPLGLALAASCAIPAHFAPVVIDGVSYIDGAVRSPTNADVLCGRGGFDLAVIVAPMAGRADLATGEGATLRRFSRMKLWIERQALDRAGIPSIVIQPGVEVTRRMGLDLMDERRAADVTREAFLDAGQQLRDHRAARLLAPLGHAPRPRGEAAAA